MSHQRNGEYKTDKDEWQTPQWLFDLLDQEFHFDCDAAATPENSKCGIWFFGIIPGQMGQTGALGISWTECRFNCKNPKTFYLNPPYSSGNIDRFMAKALEESKKGAVVVCLVPCATDTKWWHNYAMKAQEIRFIKGRVRFVGYDENGKQIKNSPTFSSCVLVFNYKGAFPMHHLRIGKTIEQPRKVSA